MCSGSVIQGCNSVAIGPSAGLCTQGVCAVAVGAEAGKTNQGANAVAVGWAAGFCTQGRCSIAIGTFAGCTNQANNSIIFNATGAALNQATANTLTVKPVRQVTSTNVWTNPTHTLPTGFFFTAYNPTTGELIYWS